MTAYIPTWSDYSDFVGHPDWLAAIALLDIEAGSVRRDACRWLNAHPYAGSFDEDRIWHPEITLDWSGWADDVESARRPWSTAEFKIHDLAVGIAAGRPINIHHALSGGLGNWEPKVWRVLVSWGTGGNNKDRPGRSEARVLTPLRF